MSKKGITIVHTTLVSRQRPKHDIWIKRFREGGTYRKRKKMWDNEKYENKYNIIFLLLLAMRQKVVL